MPLKDLRAEKGYDGPHPVPNASLNLVKGQDLALQERKAESLVMTPLFWGYDVWLEEHDSPMTRAERREETPLQALTAKKPPHKELREIFEDFGFETSKLRVPLQMTE